MWHASVSCLDASGSPVPAERLGQLVLRELQALGLLLIANVGTGAVREERLQVAFHARRALSPEELQRIDQAWLAIPAVDPG